VRSGRFRLHTLKREPDWFPGTDLGPGPRITTRSSGMAWESRSIAVVYATSRAAVATVQKGIGPLWPASAKISSGEGKGESGKPMSDAEYLAG